MALTTAINHGNVTSESLKRIRRAIHAMKTSAVGSPPWTYDANGELVVAVPGRGYMVRMEFDTNTQQERFTVIASNNNIIDADDELRFGKHKRIPFRTPEEVITYFKLTLPEGV